MHLFLTDLLTDSLRFPEAERICWCRPGDDKLEKM